MDSSMRVGQLAHEKARREAVIKAAEERAPGKGDFLRKYLNGSDSVVFCVQKIREKKEGKTPLIFADFQFWLEDYYAWQFAFGDNEGFHWEKPPVLVSTGFSKPWLEAFYKKEQTAAEKKAEEEEAEALKKKWEAMVMKPKGKGAEGMAVPTGHPDDDVFVGGRGGFMAPLEDKVQLWKEFFGDRAWEEGYEPMEIWLPEEVDPDLAVGSRADFQENLKRAWPLLGGVGTNAVLLNGRYRVDASAKHGVRVSLFLDRNRGQDLTDPFWRRSMHFAVVALWDSMTEGLFNPQWVGMFNNVESRKQMRADQLFRQEREIAKMEGDEKRAGQLMAMVRRWSKESFEDTVAARLDRAQSRDEKIQNLVKIVNQGIPPLPVAQDQRREIIAPHAKALLEQVVEAKTADRSVLLGTRLHFLGEIVLSQDPARWAALLPRGQQVAIVSQELTRWRNESGMPVYVRYNIDRMLSRISTYKDEVEFPRTEEELPDIAGLTTS